MLNIYNGMTAFSIFDPLRLPNEEKDPFMYGSEKLNNLTSMEYLTLSHLSPQLALLHQMLFLSKHKLNGNCFDD